MALFQDNKHLGKDSLKFTKQFAVKVHTEDETEVGQKEDWFTASQILKGHGMSPTDFKDTAEAVAAVSIWSRRTRLSMDMI